MIKKFRPSLLMCLGVFIAQMGCLIEVEGLPVAQPSEPGTADATTMSTNDMDVLGDAQTLIEPDSLINVDMMSNMDVVVMRNDQELVEGGDLSVRDLSGLDGGMDTMQPVQPPFFDASWTHRVRIRIVPPNIEEVVQEVPVYVRINLGQLQDAEQIQPDGDDIRFVDSTGELIPHSFVGCGVSRNNEIAMVVKLPVIVPDDMDQFMWMYYGNAAASASELSVWKDTDLAMLHVCGDAEQSQLFDSTQSNNSGALNQGVIDRRDSLWGKSVRVRPLMGGVHIPTLSGGSFTFGAFTLSFSVQFSDVGRETLILGSANPQNNRPEYRLLHLGNGTCRFEGVGLQFIVPDPVEFLCPNDSEIHHYSLLVNGSEAAMIIDGVVFDVQLPPVVFGIEQGFEPTRQMLTFLQHASGFLDEVMFSSTQMSRSWVIVRQASLMDTLLRVEY